MEPDEQKPEEQNSSPKPTKGYGKRPMWQWVLMYLVFAVVVYGIIYYVFIKDSNGGGLGY